MKINQIINEAANPAQQAAIAINMKKHGKKPKHESAVTEADRTDTVTMDVPLLIRIMEYAREDAKSDMDLHNVAEKLINLSKSHDYLCMDNYNEIVGGEHNVIEAEVWDKPNPKKKHSTLSPAKKAAARARAKAAGRPYPNMVDNIWAAKKK